MWGRRLERKSKTINRPHHHHHHHNKRALCCPAPEISFPAPRPSLTCESPRPGQRTQSATTARARDLPLPRCSPRCLSAAARPVQASSARPRSAFISPCADQSESETVRSQLHCRCRRSPRSPPHAAASGSLLFPARAKSVPGCQRRPAALHRRPLLGEKLVVQCRVRWSEAVGRLQTCS